MTESNIFSLVINVTAILAIAWVCANMWRLL